MPKDDSMRLKHMLDAAREAVQLAKGKTRRDIEEERMLNLALVRLIEIIGEAAHKVSQETRLGRPAIPWTEIIGMRNRLIHGYDEIDFDILYKTINKELPPLISKLEKMRPRQRSS